MKISAKSFQNMKRATVAAILCCPYQSFATPMSTNETETPPANSFQTDAVSLDLGFPGGGSALGTNSIGARLFLSEKSALALNLQFSLDKEQDFLAFGGTLRGQRIMATKGRSSVYTFAQLSAGATKKTSTTNSASTVLVEESYTQTGGAGGAGLEIFLLPEISLSAEVGLGAAITPASRRKIATATSQIAIHFFFPQ